MKKIDIKVTLELDNDYTFSKAKDIANELIDLVGSLEDLPESIGDIEWTIKKDK